MGERAKVAVITGATSGIGEVTAREVARAGFDVVLLCRSADKGEATRARLSAGAPGRKIEIAQADLASLAQVRRAGAEIRARHPTIDVLINNAGGIIMGPRRLTEDGLESTFASNHLGHFLLTQLLLPSLKAAGAARVVNVASLVHKSGALDFDDLQWEKRSYKGFQAYCDSKLANVLFTLELARRLAGTGVTANCLHPGVVASNFGSGNGLFSIGVKLGSLFFVSVEKGAETSIYLATSPEVAGKTGGYYTKSRLVEPAGRAKKPDVAARLWDASDRLVGTTR